MAYALHAGIDTLSIALAPAFVITLIVARKRNVYAATFLLAIALELYGTWLGNWRWEPTAPWLGVSSANPPVCIGAVYCLRDALAGYTLGGCCAGASERGATESPSSRLGSRRARPNPAGIRDIATR